VQVVVEEVVDDGMIERENEKAMAKSSTDGPPMLRRIRTVAVAAALSAMTIFIFPAAAAKQVTFASPEQAIDALVAAVRAGSTAELMNILGPGSRALISSGDEVADAQARSKFVVEYEDKNELSRESDTRAVLVIGKDEWSFPFPIVRYDAGWRFDASAGASEILDRRIGANELSTIEVCHAYVDAQHEYAEKDRNHSGFLEYAQRFLSNPGKHDGLYWPAAGDQDSPLGPLIASARAEGYNTAGVKGGYKPYHGYYYRILKGQGAAAQGGAYGYVIKGHMIAGFALVAFPAQYGASGIMTFIVSHDGVVYQKDFGPRTAELAGIMTLFDPDPSWKPL
jgi:DUF2950 family protein